MVPYIPSDAVIDLSSMSEEEVKRMGCECTRPLRGYSSANRGNHLLLWPPMLHTANKIRQLAAQLGLPVTLEGQSTCLVIDLFEDRASEDFFRQLNVLLTEEELDATQALLSATRSLAMTDVPHLRSLRRLVAALEYRWFEQVVNEGQLTCAFQPIVQAGSRDLAGYEALLRARLPNGEEVTANRLIAAARTLGQLVPLDVQARLIALEQAANHRLPGLIFINFTPTAVYDPKTCLRTTWEAAARLDIDPTRVVFEVIETESLTNLRHVSDVLSEYRQHGFRVALDDIGSGYSSLVWLGILQPDFVKIEREIVNEVSRDPVKEAIIRKLVEMAHQIGATVIAEGVEREDDARSVEDLGVDLLQGYLFGRPRILD